MRFIVSRETASVDHLRRCGFSVHVVSAITGDPAVRDTAAAVRAAAVEILVTDFDGIDPAYPAALRAPAAGDPAGVPRRSQCSARSG